MRYWLVKTEPDHYSITDLARDKVTHWHGVRNYQARNFMREMKLGDQLLVYHSSQDPAGVVGVAEVVREAYPDPSQFEKNSEYYDPKSTKSDPRWVCPDIKFVRQFAELLDLKEIKKLKGLDGMLLLQKGSRLSVQPLSQKHFSILLECASRPSGRKQVEAERAFAVRGDA